MLAQKRAFVYSSRNGGAGDGGRATPMWPYGGRCLSQKLHFYERSHGEQIVFFSLPSRKFLRELENMFSCFYRVLDTLMKVWED